MIINQHTPDGTIKHKLTQKELKKMAAMGDYRARIAITRDEVNLGVSLDKKVNLVLWVLGIENAKPKSKEEA